MHFNGTILDFYKKFDSLTLHDLTLVEAKDPFWAKLVNTKFRSKHEEFTSRWGEDISADWVNEVWFDLSLFADTNTYFIYNLDKADVKTLSRFKELQTSAPTFLHFNKEPKGFSKSLKIDYSFVKIKEFNFWEVEKLLDFYSVLLESNFSSAIRQHYSSWGLELKQEIYDQLIYLQLIYKDLGSISQEQIDEVITVGDLNPFVLTDYMTNKNMNSLYRDLLRSLKNDYWAGSHKAVSFLRSFVLKAVDLDYKNKKPKLNSFDKKVLSVQSKFSSRELSNILKDISNWEILIKRKDKTIIQDLQSRIIALK